LSENSLCRRNNQGKIHVFIKFSEILFTRFYSPFRQNSFAISLHFPKKKLASEFALSDSLVISIVFEGDKITFGCRKISNTCCVNGATNQMGEEDPNLWINPSDSVPGVLS